MTDEQASALADYIIGWLVNRDGGKLRNKLDAQKVSERDRMRGELTMILKAGGKPANWVS